MDQDQDQDQKQLYVLQERKSTLYYRLSQACIICCVVLIIICLTTLVRGYIPSVFSDPNSSGITLVNPILAYMLVSISFSLALLGLLFVSLSFHIQKKLKDEDQKENAEMV